MENFVGAKQCWREKWCEEKWFFTFPGASKFSPNSLWWASWQASNAIILIWNGHTQEFTHTLKVRPTFSLKCLRKCNLRCSSKGTATTVIVIVFWIIIFIFRLYYQESWSQTRGIWSDAWWEVYHCLFGAELLVSICLKSKHVLAKISLLSKGGPELVKMNKTVSPEFEKSTERGSCSRYFIDESDVLWRAFSSWFLETRFVKSERKLLLHIYHIFKRAEFTFTREIAL